MHIPATSFSLSLYDYLYVRLDAVQIFKRRIQDLERFHHAKSVWPIQFEAKQGIREPAPRLHLP